MKIGYKFLSFVLTLGIIFSMFSVNTALTTSAAGIIEIDTAEELRLIGRDSAYPMSGNYVLTADIDVGDKEWVAIGFKDLSDTSPDAFSGTFDGQGHVISNMWTEDRTDPENPTYRNLKCKMWGFIAKSTSKITVKNLGFKDVYFNIGRSAQDTNYVGTVVGYMENGSSLIENVAVLSGKIICENFYHQVIVGGITVGHGNIQSPGHIIRNCFNGADISVKPGSYSQYSSYGVAGGILGNTTSKNLNTVTVENCFNAGKITLTRSSNTKKYTYLSVVGDIIARAGTKSGTVDESNAKLINNFAVSGNINNNFTYGTQYSTDLSTTEIIYAVDAGNVNSYDALTSLKDSNGSALWVVSEGKYPIPAALSAYAQDAVVPNYTLIETLEELSRIGVDAEYPANGFYKLANNIDAGDTEWTPITKFSGLIDGNGYIISGLNIGKTEAVSRSYSEYGFIGTLSGTVRNLKLTDIYYNTYSSTGTSYIGGIAGVMSVGKINNCFVSGTIVDTTTKKERVGGIAGHTTSAWEIKNCFSDVDIIAGYSAAISGGELGAAGIIGNAEKAGILSDCISIGKIDAKYPGYVGAIASHYFGLSLPVEIKNCYSNADIDYWATADIKAFNPQGDNYTLVTKYEMLSGALAGKLPASYWTDDATDLMPYLNVFAVPAVSTQTEETAADAVEADIRATVLTNYTTQSDLIAIAENCLEKGSLKFAITNYVVTKAKILSEGNLELTFTVGEATRRLTLSIAPIPEFDYDFSTKYAGRADGTITITDANYSGKNYRLYWGDNNGILAGYDVLATINDLTVTDAKKGILTYTQIQNSYIPENATKLYLAIDNSLVAEIDIPAWRVLKKGTLKYTSAHISDTHFGYSRSAEAFKKVLETMASMGGTVITNSGDITDRGTYSDYDVYESAHTSKYSNITFWPTLGNHDILLANRADGIDARTAFANVKASITNFANPEHTLGSDYIVTVPDESEEDVLIYDYSRKNNVTTTITTEGYTLQTDYTMSYKDDMYIFMSAGKAFNSASSYNDDIALTDKQLAWLEKTLNNYYNVEKKNGQTYFIFHFATLENGLGATDGYKNYVESSAKLYEILDKYPIIHMSGHTHIPYRSDKNIHVGTNHTAIQTPSITKGHQAYEGYVIEHYENYTIIKGYNFLTKEYITNAMFYIAKEYPEIESEAYFVIDAGSQGNKDGITTSNVNITDNKFYRTARKITQTTETSAVSKDTFIVPYSKTLSVADNQTFNQLHTFLHTAGAEIRTYIKNDNDYEVSFKPGIFAAMTYNSSSTVYPKAVTNEYITLPANSGWVEIRLKLTDLNMSAESLERFLKGESSGSYVGLTINPKPDNFLKNNGDTIYVTPLEVFNRDITEEITTDFDYYNQILVANAVYDTTNTKAYITKTKNTTGEELPFFNQTISFTAKSEADGYDNTAPKLTEQNGFIKKAGMKTAEFKDWAVYNTSAEMRFWVKTDKDVKFTIGLYIASGGEIKATVNCTASDDWQEIRLKRSDFSNSNGFTNILSTASVKDLYIKMYVTKNFEAEQSISFGNRVEFFTHEAYDKGDANRDGNVNLKDLVSFKKKIVNNDTEFVNCDIDSDSKLSATDLSYLRKWIINGNWK